MNETNVTEEKVEAVRERYGRIAVGEISGCGCGLVEGSEAAIAGGIGYTEEELATLPDEANLGLGCGAPVALLAPAAGETVLDLGSGAGIDAFLAARRVGASGRVIGVDMTPEMLEKARAAAARMGFENVEFRAGRLEALPVAEATVDAVTSNCVINLVPDKPAVFREIARVLKPGGRLVVSDILLSRPLPETIERDLLSYVGCIAGAAVREGYFRDLAAAGLSTVEILRESDYLETMRAAAPGEIAALLERTGVEADDVRGVVQSVTYRAWKGTPAKGTEACCGPEGCEECGCPPSGCACSAGATC
jgi:ubiquinone/menaquinone biosynthesis C-methylase UbiE